MKKHIGKIILFFSLLSFISTIVIFIYEILGSMVFNWNYNLNFLMIGLLIAGAILLALYRIIDLLEHQ